MSDPISNIDFNQLNCGFTSQVIRKCMAHGLDASVLVNDKDAPAVSDFIEISQSDVSVKIKVVAKMSGPYFVTDFIGDVERFFVILEEPDCGCFSTAEEYVEKVIFPLFSVSPTVESVTAD
jgi:hypothetical protein